MCKKRFVKWLESLVMGTHHIKIKIHPCGSDVISELDHTSLCGRNETRTVKSNPKNPPEPTASERLATRLVAGEGQQAWKRSIIIVH